jgi:hypothetical protein
MLKYNVIKTMFLFTEECDDSSAKLHEEMPKLLLSNPTILAIIRSKENNELEA